MKILLFLFFVYREDFSGFDILLSYTD